VVGWVKVLESWVEVCAVRRGGRVADQLKNPRNWHVGRRPEATYLPPTLGTKRNAARILGGKGEMAVEEFGKVNCVSGVGSGSRPLELLPWVRDQISTQSPYFLCTSSRPGRIVLKERLKYRPYLRYLPR